MLKFTKPCYRADIYKQMRKFNREQYTITDDTIIEDYKEFEKNYVVKVDNEVFYIDNFFGGLGVLRKDYFIDIPRFNSFDEVFFLHHRMPPNIQYFAKIYSSEFKTEVKFVSKDMRFTHTFFGENGINWQITSNHTEEECEEMLREVLFE